jgi:hypothetical protein
MDRCTQHPLACSTIVSHKLFLGNTTLNTIVHATVYYESMRRMFILQLLIKKGVSSL